MKQYTEADRQALIDFLQGSRLFNYMETVRLEKMRDEIALASLETKARKVFTCSGCGFASLEEPAESDCHCFIDGRKWIESEVYTAPPAPVVKIPSDAELLEIYCMFANPTLGARNALKSIRAEVLRLNNQG